MTRKSKRELERAVEDLGGDAPPTVRKWVDQCLQSSFLAYGPEDDVAEAVYTVVNSDGEVIREPDHEGEVKIWEPRSGGIKTGMWIPEETVPEWIDREDLPVRG